MTPVSHATEKTKSCVLKELMHIRTSNRNRRKTKNGVIFIFIDSLMYCAVKTFRSIAFRSTDRFHEEESNIYAKEYNRFGNLCIAV
jgi:hypothetical protein